MNLDEPQRRGAAAGQSRPALRGPAVPCPERGLVNAVYLVDFRASARSTESALPGFRIPAGSNVALTARSTCTPRSPTSSRIHGRWSAPTAWWWVMVPPAVTIASECSLLGGQPTVRSDWPPLPGDDGEVTATLRWGTHEKCDTSPAPVCRFRASAVVSASVTAGFQLGNVGPIGGGPRASRRAPRRQAGSSRRYGAPKRPRSHACAGPSPSDVPALGRQQCAGFGMPALDVFLGALETR